MGEGRQAGRTVRAGRRKGGRCVPSGCRGRYSLRPLATPLIQIQEMLDRGMSADEIETIFAAAWTGKSRRLSRWFRSALPARGKVAA